MYHFLLIFSCNWLMSLRYCHLLLYCWTCALFDERCAAHPSLSRRMPPCYSARALGSISMYAHMCTRDRRAREQSAHYSGRRVRWVDNILVALCGNISYCYPRRFHKVNKSARALLLYMWRGLTRISQLHYRRIIDLKPIKKLYTAQHIS